MKKFVITFFVATCFILSLAALPALAQTPIPIGPGGAEFQVTPIGGIAVAAALGGGYALKKLNDMRHKD